MTTAKRGSRKKRENRVLEEEGYTLRLCTYTPTRWLFLSVLTAFGIIAL